MNMVDAGILDPAKVTRSALQNATSVASTLLTTELFHLGLGSSAYADNSNTAGQLCQSLLQLLPVEIGSGLFNLAETLEGDEKTGASLVLKALESPLYHIAANAGLEGSVIINKVRESEPGVGFDVLKEFSLSKSEVVSSICFLIWAMRAWISLLSPSPSTMTVFSFEAPYGGRSGSYKSCCGRGHHLRRRFRLYPCCQGSRQAC